MSRLTSLRLLLAAGVGLGSCAGPARTTRPTTAPIQTGQVSATVAPRAPLSESTVVVEAEPGHDLRRDFRPAGVIITTWWCSLTGRHTITLQGPKEALDRARQLPIVVREIRPGEPNEHPLAPSWDNKLDFPGLCFGELEASARVSFHMKISGALTSEKRTVLEGLGTKITSLIGHATEDATLMTGEAPGSALIGLAQLDFVVRIERPSRLHLLR